MLVKDFDYELPPELIAQQPLEPRDHSRLMVVDRQQHSTASRFFYELPAFLSPGDLLVFNDTRVIPARLFARKETLSGARIEVFLLKQLNTLEWECLIKPAKRVRLGTRLLFPQAVTAEIIMVLAGGVHRLVFSPMADFRGWLAANGQTPLPPYITQSLVDPERYQTIYAKAAGSVAAPTAGLHFTPELMARLAAQGVRTGYLTLEIGLGTFRPVQTERVEEHLMHEESFTLSPALAAAINTTKQAGKRVIAVGTTVVRVLESQAQPDGKLRSGSGTTAIFIYPGFRFQVINGLLTNFHLPRSSLLMLVAAWAGRDLILNSYQQAINEKYRFFSFGDAMLIY